jgi:RNA polymerase sigma factor for flagellar operon FliA
LDAEPSLGDAEVLSQFAEGPAARERTFLALLPTIDRIVSFVCRRNRLGPAEADDFRSLVRLKLIENDYDALRRYRGQSSFRTYLAVVIQRRFLDYRISEWGKWRPSAEARRLGPAAVELERLTTRDGLTDGEAIETLRTRAGAGTSETELRQIQKRLPSRTPRRFVSAEAVESLAGGEDPEEDAMRSELAPAARRAHEALAGAIRELPAQERLILRMRFGDSFTVAEIAATLRLDQKQLYRRIEGLLAALRRRIEHAGLGPSEVSDLLFRPFDHFFPESGAENPALGPSLQTGSGE